MEQTNGTRSIWSLLNGSTSQVPHQWDTHPSSLHGSNFCQFYCELWVGLLPPSSAKDEMWWWWNESFAGKIRKSKEPSSGCLHSPYGRHCPHPPPSPANMGRNNILYSSTLPLSFLSGNDFIPHSFWTRQRITYFRLEPPFDYKKGSLCSSEYLTCEE